MLAVAIAVVAFVLRRKLFPVIRAAQELFGVLSTREPAVRTAMAFEFYLRRVWPFHRVFAKSRLGRRCSRCAASHLASPIDGSGACEDCRAKPGSPAAAGGEPQPPNPSDVA